MAQGKIGTEVLTAKVLIVAKSAFQPALSKRVNAVFMTAAPCRIMPMKSMTCGELGGKCDQRLSANSWDDMVKAMTEHVMEKHLDGAKTMEKMHNEDPKKWGREMQPKWEAAPEV